MYEEESGEDVKPSLPCQAEIKPSKSSGSDGNGDQSLVNDSPQTFVMSIKIEDPAEEEDVIIGACASAGEESSLQPGKKVAAKKTIYKCGKEFFEVCELSRHMQSHTGERPQECTACGKWFPEKQHLRVHLQVHTGEKPYSCSVCGRHFTQLGGKSAHGEVHFKETEETPVSEPEVKREEEEGVDGTINSDGKEKDWPSHIPKDSQSIDHRDDEVLSAPDSIKELTCSTKQEQPVKQEEGPRPAMPHHCSECGRTFPHPYDLMLHQREHFRRQIFRCFICAALFNSETRLTKHEEEEHPGEIPDELYPLSAVPLLPPDCGMRFATERPVGTRQKNHISGASELCSKCGKSFTSLWQLKRHERLHTGERPYGCLECGKRFMEPSHLTLHLQTHSRKRPHHCSVCGKSYIRADELKVHYRIHPGEKPYICDQEKGDWMSPISREIPDQFSCEEESPPALEQPQVKRKTKTPHCCLLCGKEFACNAHLQRHVRIHTGEKAYKCFVCGRGFTKKGHLQTHLKDVYRGHISKEELENVLSLRTTLTEAASILGVSRATLYKLMREHHMTRTKFGSITNEELDYAVSEIKTEHPHVGEVRLHGHLRSRNIEVQRNRLRKSIRRVDSASLLSKLGGEEQ